MYYVYGGTARNLGRFGFVQQGAIIDLTQAEADSVAGDPLFVDASKQVYDSVGNPETVVTAAKPAICVDATGGVYKKTATGLSNTGWEQLL